MVSGYLTDILLEIGPLDLPFMTGGLDEHRKAASQLRPFFAEMLAKRGLKLLAINTWPTRQLFPREAIRTVGDWKGKKIRVYGADSANTARALGAAPVSIGFGEVYTALEKKTVDGAMTSATNAEPMKFFEVSRFTNYWYLAGAGRMSAVMLYPLWWPMLLIPAGLALLALAMLARLGRQVRAAVGSRAARDQVGPELEG